MLHGKATTAIWTCRSVLPFHTPRLPRVLKAIQATTKSAAEHCHVMFKVPWTRRLSVVDDGGLSGLFPWKTL
jgi:hypothetical protein